MIKKSRRAVLSGVALLLLAVLMVFMLPLGQAHALERQQIIRTMETLRYLQYEEGGAWYDLITPHHTLEDGTISYCIEHRLDGSTMYYTEVSADELYSQTTLIGLQIILENGYPSSELTIGADAARYATQNAIRFWMAERGEAHSESYMIRSANRVRAKEGSEGVMNAIDYLLDLARAQQPFRATVSFSPSNLELVREGDYFVGTTTVTTNANGGYLLDESGLPSGSRVEGYTGNSGDVLKLFIPRSGNANKTIRLNATGRDTRSRANLHIMAPDSSSNQRMVAWTFDMYASQDYDTFTAETPKYGWIEIIKTDAHSGLRVPGATFQIYERESGRLVETLVTDRNGYAKSSDLMPEAHIIKESGVPVGYVDEDFNVTWEVEPDTTISKTVTNKPIWAQIEIIKQDSETAETPQGDAVLYGGVFRIVAAETIRDSLGNVKFNSGDTVQDNLTSSTRNRITSQRLYPGKYHIYEITPPTGYNPLGQPVLVDTITATAQNKVEVVLFDGVVKNDVIKRPIEIIKFLGQNEERGPGQATPEKPEAGAEFDIILKSSGRVYAHLVTDERGWACSDPLPYGLYIVRQTKGTEGHATFEDYEVMVNEHLPDTPILLIIDNFKEKMQLRVMKRDVETNKIIPLSGTTFKIWDLQNNEYIEQVTFYPNTQTHTEFTTDESGAVQLPNRLDYGEYELVEIQAPEGYALNTDRVRFKISHAAGDPDDTQFVIIDFHDMPIKGKIRIIKTGLQFVGVEDAIGEHGVVYTPVFEERQLAGAVFEIIAAHDVYTPDGTLRYEDGEVVDTVTTTADEDDWTQELYLGTYYVREVEVPEHMVIDYQEQTITLESQGQEVPVVEYEAPFFNRYQETEAEVIKEAEDLQPHEYDDGTILSEIRVIAGEGFTFGLFADQNYTLPCDEKEINKLTFDGYGDSSYIRIFTNPDGEATESTEAMAGNAAVAGTFKAEYSEDGVLLADGSYYLLAEGTREYTPFTVAGGNAECLVETGITISAERITVTEEIIIPSGALVCVGTTDEEGRLVFADYVPHGLYFVQELAVADPNFMLDETIYPVDLNYNPEVIEIEARVSEDAIQNYLRTITGIISKTDITGEKAVAGALIEVLNDDGELIFREYTDEKGEVEILLLPGSYTYRETLSPEFYELNTHTFEFEVTQDGEIVGDMTMVDDYTRYELLKVDEDGNTIEGAKFGLYDDEGRLHQIAKSDEDGIVRFEKIGFGEWTIRETKAAEGFALTGRQITFTVTGKYVNAVEPTEFMNEKNRFELLKVNPGNRVLAGAEFGLYNADDELVASAVSGDDGIVRFEGMAFGEYTIRENKALDGYQHSHEEVSVKVDDQYKNPDSPTRFVNYPSIQTGNDTLPTLSIILLAAAGVLIIAFVVVKVIRRRKR